MTSGTDSRTHNRILFFIGIFTLGIFLNSCVSVSVKPKQAKKNKDITFTKPASMFVPVDQNQFDEAWTQPAQSISLAFLSECQLAVDSSKERITQEFLSTFEDAEVLDQSTLQWNQRESLKTHAKVKLDGLQLEAQFLVLKKNGCDIILTYMAPPEHFNNYIQHYQTFTKNMKVP